MTRLLDGALARHHLDDSQIGPTTWTPLPRPAARTGYGLPVLVAALASMTWFTPGRFLGSGDVAPFVRDSLSREIAASWNHQVTGAGSASYAITQLPEVLLLRLTTLLGLPGWFAQQLLYTTVVATAAFGTAFLAAVWLRKPIPVAVAGLVGVFNSFVLVTLPNLLPLLAIALIGLLAGTVLRGAAGANVSARRVAMLSLPIGYLAQNPPLVVVVLIAVLAAAAGGTVLTGGGGSRRAFLLMIRAAPIVLMLNLYWIVPYLLTLSSESGLTFAAQTDVGAWAWTQVRSSLGNVLTLNTHWGWRDPDYFPFAASMDRFPFDLLRWLLPILAFAGLLAAGRASKRRRQWTLAAAALVLVWLAKGLHQPMSAPSSWLYAHLPGMWLLRDPMSKLGAALVAIYAIGVGHLADAAGRRLRTVPSLRLRRIGGATGGLIVAAALAYPWPLYTGAVVPGARGYLPSDRVAIPPEWRSVAEFVNSHGDSGKTVIYPLDPYYQITTTWGYHGVDTIPAQLLHNPVVQELPGGYFTAGAGVDALLEGSQTALLAGDTAGVPQRLRALGASTIIVRHDLAASPDLPAAADASQLSAVLDHTPGVTLAARYPLADIYHLDDAGPVQLTANLLGMHAEDPTDVSAAVGSLPPHTALTTDPRLPVTGFSWQVDQTDRQNFTLANAGRYRLRATAVAEARYRARADRATGTVIMTDADTVSLDGRPLPARPDMSLSVTDANVTALDINGTLTSLGGAAGADVTVPAIANVTAYAPTGPAQALTPDQFSPLGDCNRFDPRTPTQAGLGLSEPGRGTLQLSAVSHSACTFAPIVSRSGRDLVEIGFDYRVVSGAPARFCLWQVPADACVPLGNPRRGSTGAWQHFVSVGRVGHAGTSLRLYLYADGPSQGGSTIVQYRSIHITALRPVGAATLTAKSAAPATRYLDAGSHTVTFASTEQPRAPDSVSPLGDCNNAFNQTPDQAGLVLQRDNTGVVRLSALADAACVTAQPAIDNPGSLYRLQVSYRTVSGRPARLCLWQVGPDSCAEAPALETSNSWRTLTATIPIASGTRRLRLYLYADGQAAPPTTVEYRDVRLTRAAAVSVSVTPDAATGSRAGPTAQLTGLSSNEFHVTARDLNGSAALVLTESFAPGWHLTGLPKGWSEEHFEAYGYANGWWLHGTGTAHLTLLYGPQHWSTVATWLSLSTLLVIAVAQLVRRARARAHPLRPPAILTHRVRARSSQGRHRRPPMPGPTGSSEFRS